MMTSTVAHAQLALYWVRLPEIAIPMSFATFPIF